VSPLHPATDDAEVISCARDVLGQDSIFDITCSRLKSKHVNLYSSFHVSVNVGVDGMKPSIDKLMAAESWPSGILVRRYFKPKNGEQG
jgi:hypothetical protein